LRGEIASPGKLRMRLRKTREIFQEEEIVEGMGKG